MKYATTKSIKIIILNDDDATLSSISILPFSITIQDRGSGEITFYMKGADTVMSSIVQYSDWLEEEVNN